MDWSHHLGAPLRPHVRSMEGVGPLPSARLVGLLSPAACAELVRALEARGFAPTGGAYPPSYRDNDRLVLDDPALAAALFARVRDALPDTLTFEGTRWTLDGLNPRFRACRYRDGQAFCVHRDGPWVADPARRTLLTLQLYLNGAEAFRGGHTRFYADATAAHTTHAARPAAGDAIAFDHAAWHDGEPVHEGTKYVLRTDVLFRRAPAERALAPGARRHEGYAWCVTALADGTLASGGRDGRVLQWRDGPPAATDLRDGSVVALGALPDGGWVAGTRAGRLHLRGPSLEATVALPGAVLSLHVAGPLVHAALSDGSVASLRDGRLVRHEPRHAGWAWAVLDTPAGLASVGADGRLVLEAREALRVDAALTALCWHRGALLAGDARGRVHGPGGSQARHAGAVTSLASLGADLLASTGEDGRLALTDGGALAWEHRSPDFVRSAARTPRGVAWCGYDGYVHERALPGPDAPRA